jgi:hypothetical protein
MSYRSAFFFLLVTCFLSACPETPDPDGPIATFECGACSGDCLIEQFAISSASHISGGLDYPNLPPTSGDHDPCWAEYGVHDTELADENWVHNLEHGAVVYLYNCSEGCAADVAILESVAANSPADTTIVSPYSGMDASFAAVAWGWRITLGCADETALADFYVEHAGQAPEDTTAGPPSGCVD